jgi:hypothetical protein
MKIAELQDHFKDYYMSNTTAAGIGCYKEVVIRTSTDHNSAFGYPDGNNRTCSVESLVQTHQDQVWEEEAKHVEAAKYIRLLPEIRKHLDEDGEFSGVYSIRSRIQFGRVGECITIQQAENLKELGWRLE